MNKQKKPVKYIVKGSQELVNSITLNNLTEC